MNKLSFNKARSIIDQVDGFERIRMWFHWKLSFVCTKFGVPQTSMESFFTSGQAARFIMHHPEAQPWRDRWETEFSPLVRYAKKSATVYSDASFHKGRFTYAFSITAHNSRKKYGDRCPAEVENIDQAELYAIMRSLWLLEKHMDTTGYELIYVRTDSMNAIRAITAVPSQKTGTTGKMVQHIQKVLLRNKWKLNIRHVRSHQRNDSVQTYMNNQADAMAKAIHNKK